MIVDLYEFPDLGLIIKAATGVRYTSQVAGYACEHPEVEGFLVPLVTKSGRPEIAALSGFFQGDWGSLNDERADSLDAMLIKHGFTSLRLDRTMLAESKEAWLHVVISNTETQNIPLKLEQPQEAKGILIWPNSD